MYDGNQRIRKRRERLKEILLDRVVDFITSAAAEGPLQTIEHQDLERIVLLRGAQHLLQLSGRGIGRDLDRNDAVSATVGADRRDDGSRGRELDPRSSAGRRREFCA